MSAAGPSGVGRGLLLGDPTGWDSSDGALDGSIDEHLVGWLRRRLEWQTFATRQINCNATADLEVLEEGEKRIVTPRGWIVDMMMSMTGGVLCGYLFVQLLTVLYYMNSHSLKPKQPHVLLWQTLAAMVLTSSLLIYHGHFRREARRTTPRAAQAPASVGTRARSGGGVLRPVRRADSRRGLGVWAGSEGTMSSR